MLEWISGILLKLQSSSRKRGQGMGVSSKASSSSSELRVLCTTIRSSRVLHARTLTMSEGLQSSNYRGKAIIFVRSYKHAKKRQARTAPRVKSTIWTLTSQSPWDCRVCSYEWVQAERDFHQIMISWKKQGQISWACTLNSVALCTYWRIVSTNSMPPGKSVPEWRFQSVIAITSLMNRRSTLVSYEPILYSLNFAFKNFRQGGFNENFFLPFAKSAPLKCKKKKANLFRYNRTTFQHGTIHANKRSEWSK